MRIKAFRALHPQSETVHLVASVPYDTVDTAEARRLADGNPMSFLRVVRPEIDLPPDTDIHSDQVYARAAETFASFISESVLIADDSEHLYVYRLKMGEHVQSGVVACCHIEDYEAGKVRKHEKTRRDKEDDRTRHVLSLNANTGPVFMTYRQMAKIDDIVARAEERPPLLDFVAQDGVAHTVWRIDDMDEIVSVFDNVDLFYIADGHHRAAASARAGAEKRAANADHSGEEEYNWFLSVLFPADQLNVLPYNRCVADLNGLSEDEFLAEVQRDFNVRDDAEASPGDERHINMYIGGKWHELQWSSYKDSDPVASLDVSVLQDRLLDPILGISDPRVDDRIEFIGGIRGTHELESRVDSGRAAVAFSMFPVTVEQMMAIADAHEIMPPKSTWFEPKLRSGLLVHLL